MTTTAQTDLQAAQTAATEAQTSLTSISAQLSTIQSNLTAALAALAQPPVTPPVTPPAPSTPVPTITDGSLKGNWTLKFDQNFASYTSAQPDTSYWKNPARYNAGTNMRFVGTNAVVQNGKLYLICVSGTGAMVSSAQFDGAGKNGYEVAVGDFVEIKVMIPGNAQDLYNYFTFWLDGQHWPAGGEADVLEILSGQPTDNYHGTSHSKNYGDVFGGVGAIANKTVTIGVRRGSASEPTLVYLNGRKVNSYTPGDNGTPEAILLSVTPNGKTNVQGLTGAIEISYVYAWSRS